jgi:hypothetical protein
MCFRRQFWRVTKPVGRPWCFLTWLHVTLLNFSHYRSTDHVHPSPALHFGTFKVRVFLIYFPKFPSSSTIKSYAPNVALYWFRPEISVQVAGEKSSYSSNTASLNFTCTSCIICYQPTWIWHAFCHRSVVIIYKTRVSQLNSYCVHREATFRLTAMTAVVLHWYAILFTVLTFLSEATPSQSTNVKWLSH